MQIEVVAIVLVALAVGQVALWATVLLRGDGILFARRTQASAQSEQTLPATIDPAPLAATWVAEMQQVADEASRALDERIAAASKLLAQLEAERAQLDDQLAHNVPVTPAATRITTSDTSRRSAAKSTQPISVPPAQAQRPTRKTSHMSIVRHHDEPDMPSDDHGSAPIQSDRGKRRAHSITEVEAPPIPPASSPVTSTRRTRSGSRQRPSSPNDPATFSAATVPAVQESRAARKLAADDYAKTETRPAGETIAPRDQVVSLAAKGLSHQEIARATGLNLAEVELCLTLAGITSHHVVAG